MIAAANRSCAASDRSGPVGRARPSQLTQIIATTVTIAGGTHHNRISTGSMMLESLLFSRPTHRRCIIGA